jgi:hypothetical protein
MPHIRAKVGDDAGALVDALILIATGTTEQINEAYGCTVTLRDRMTAIESLLEKGWQKPATKTEHDLPEDREVTVRFGGRYRPTDAPPDDGE